MTSSRSCKPWGRATRRSAMQGLSLLHGKTWLSTERTKKMMWNSTLVSPDAGGSRRLLSVLTLSLWQQTSVVLVPLHCSANQPFHEVRLAAFHLPPPRQCRCGRPLDACGHHRFVRLQGFLGEGATRWKLLQPRSVEKQVLVCDSTPWSETWIFCLGHSLTTGGWRRRSENQVVWRWGSCKIGGVTEVGGRWSQETRQFLVALAKAKSREAPPPLQGSVKAVWLHRWSCILACTAARSLRCPS